MKPRSKAVPGILLAALLALFLGSACVRLNEPAAYRCASDADCDSDEHCSTFGQCQTDSICEFDDDCKGDRICIASSCVDPQCTQPSGQCGLFACSLGRCMTSCSGNSSCRPGATCVGFKCFDPGTIANDQACTADAVCQSQHCCVNSPGSGVCRASCAKSVGATCALGVECASSFCCPTKGQMPLTCAAVPCSQVPECDFDLDCNGGKCTAGKCVAVAPQKNGANCSSSAHCLSTFCQGGTCRAATGEACTLDGDCQVSHRCCLGQTGSTGVCSGDDGKCQGRLGARCTKNEDCISGTCNEGAWCTQNCATNAECGVSPLGDANACETNAFGEKICFPGCSSDSECHSYFGASYYCDPAFDSAAKICTYN